MGAEVQEPGPSSAAFQDIGKEVDQKWSRGDISRRPYGMPVSHGRGLACCATVLTAKMMSVMISELYLNENIQGIFQTYR